VSKPGSAQNPNFGTHHGVSNLGAEARWLFRQQRWGVFHLVVPKAVPYLCTLVEVQRPAKAKGPHLRGF
jgi:hypothetical protein